MNHHQGFYLDESMFHHSFHLLSKATYKTFLNFQNQCETRWIQDTRDFLDFLNGFLTFVQDYVDIFFEVYMKKSLKNYETFIDTEMRVPLENKKQEVKTLFSALHKKLKPLHGHPNNRHLLEKLEIEAKVAEMEAKEILDENNLPSKSMIKERLEAIVQEFTALNRDVPEVEDIPNPIKTIEGSLFLQLHEKYHKFKVFVNDIKENENNGMHEAFINHCTSFLSIYERAQADRSFIDEPQMISPSMTWKSDKTTSTKSASLTKTPGQSTVILTIEEGDAFQTDLRDIYQKFVKELNVEKFDVFIEKLMKEWDHAVETVVELYRVKYNQ